MRVENMQAMFDNFWILSFDVCVACILNMHFINWLLSMFYLVSFFDHFSTHPISNFPHFVALLLNHNKNVVRKKHCKKKFIDMVVSLSTVKVDMLYANPVICDAILRFFSIIFSLKVFLESFFIGVFKLWGRISIE